MNSAAIKAIVEGVVPAVIAHLDERMEVAAAKWAASIPVPKDGKDADQDAVIEAVLKRIPVPKDGKDAVVDIDAIVERVKAGYSHPKDGKDAEVDLDDLAKKAAALIPVPKDGKDAEPVDTQAIVAEIQKSIAVPKDGRDADEEAVVEKVLARMPNLGTIVESVKASIPVPKDGKDAPAVDVHAVAAEAAKLIRQPVDGRDALDIEVLESVDTQKSYPRGTWAAWRGGVIRSFRITDPITDDIERSGWHVVINGQSDIEFELEGDRGVVARTVTTKGRVIEKRWKLPHLIYRGIFREGEPYEAGDSVTWGGGIWIALKDNPEGKPRESADWQLAVKPGRDGRDRN